MRALAVVLALLLLPTLAGAQEDAVRVAVLDTGVDGQHPELAGRVERRSFADPVGLPGVPLPGAVPDPDGRGTAVASLVAGESLGVAPDAWILDLQVQGAGQPTPAEVAANAQEALAWILAQEDAPRVALLSFSEDAVPDAEAATLAGQVRSLWERGVLAIVAPGAGEALAGSPHVLTVGGLEDCVGNVDAPGRVPKPDLVAPSTGLEVAQPTVAGQSGQDPTTTRSGTALAAAQVAGAAAAVLAERPDLPVDALAAILRDHAQGDAWEPCVGWGIVDVEASVAAARGWEPPSGGPKNDAPAAPLAVLGLALAVLAWRRRA